MADFSIVSGGSWLGVELGAPAGHGELVRPTAGPGCPTGGTRGHQPRRGKAWIYFTPHPPIRGSTLPGAGNGSVGLPGSRGFMESNGEASREGLFLLLVFLIILVLILIKREHKNPS